MKTHIWIRRDGCIITTMTSLPIDLADARRDSWQHGTKLVWAAVPSVVRCHDRGGSDYLDDCPPGPRPSLPGLIGLVLVSEEDEEEVGDPGNERMDWSGPSLRLSSTSSVHCGKETGPIDWTFNIYPRITWWRKCTNPPWVQTGTNCLDAMPFYSFLNERDGFEINLFGAIMVPF